MRRLSSSSPEPPTPTELWIWTPGGLGKVITITIVVTSGDDTATYTVTVTAPSATPAEGAVLAYPEPEQRNSLARVLERDDLTTPHPSCTASIQTTVTVSYCAHRGTAGITPADARRCSTKRCCADRDTRWPWPAPGADTPRSTCGNRRRRDDVLQDRHHPRSGSRRRHPVGSVVWY